MEFIRREIDGVVEIRPKRHGDARGHFSETYRRSAFAEQGIADEFVQGNSSLSISPGTVRGLHYQLAPHAQGKLVSVLRGAIYDVALDIRKGSPTFGRHVGVTLTAENRTFFYVPVGFAHGFCTLEPDTEVAYGVSAYYSAAHERAILWSDPALGIDWPLPPEGATVSDKDAIAPLLQDAAQDAADLF